MTFNHGNVHARAVEPHPAHRRYIALMDILGMKAWLDRDPAQSIAEHLDRAFVASDQSSCGDKDGVPYGPLVGVAHFSDTLLAWSPDESWASLAALVGAVKMIVGVALTQGVPLRGSIALGDVVCKPRTSRFVGAPIVDAYLWAEKNRDRRKYHSAGVDFTSTTIAELRNKLSTDPIPEHWELDPDVIRRDREASHLLVWHEDCLFVDHWHHGMFNLADPKAMFLHRDLPTSPTEQNDADEKARQLQEFAATSRRLRSSIPADPPREKQREYRELQASHYADLDTLRKERDSE